MLFFQVKPLFQKSDNFGLTHQSSRIRSSHRRYSVRKGVLRGVYMRNDISQLAGYLAHRDLGDMENLSYFHFVFI